MIKVKSFCFNSFEENTYVVSDSSNECVIIDPGCHLATEESELKEYIFSNGLKPVLLVNTHCHIDHILGNKFVSSTFNLTLQIHKNEIPVLQSSEMVSKLYLISLNPSPKPDAFLKEGDQVKFGNSVLEVLFTPGHSPGSISFYSPENNFVISGDVLFENSIGRTDLPGGDYETLIQSILQKLIPLGDKVKVYPGHGDPTTIGQERKQNPFLSEHIEN